MGIVEEVHNEMVERLGRGDERGAVTYLKSRFNELPEELQGEILTRAYLHAMQEKTARMELVNEVQEESIATLQAIEILEEQLKKEKQQEA